MRQADGQDVRHFNAPNPAPNPKPTPEETEAQIAAVRERNQRRRGRSATVIAGLNERRVQATQKEVLGG